MCFWSISGLIFSMHFLCRAHPQLRRRGSFQRAIWSQTRNRSSDSRSVWARMRKPHATQIHSSESDNKHSRLFPVVLPSGGSLVFWIDYRLHTPPVLPPSSTHCAIIFRSTTFGASCFFAPSTMPVLGSVLLFSAHINKSDRLCVCLECVLCAEFSEKWPRLRSNSPHCNA